MKAATRLSIYGACLAVLLVAGLAVGKQTNFGRVAVTSGGHGNHAEETAVKGLPGGLQVSQNGYTLELNEPVVDGGDREVSFRIIGAGGQPLSRYEESHDKRLHLIAVRRDLSGFQHVHPTFDRASGTWRSNLALSGGSWRLFADFVPTGGEATTLATDLLVNGDNATQGLPQPSRTATVSDPAGDYTVTLRGDLTAGKHSMLTLEVSQDGRPVTNLQPYLGAYGHLVALRQGDLAYLHVHPGGEPGDGKTKPGPQIEFGAEVPSAGRYYLFLDFKHQGTVRTAAFTLDTGAAQAAPKPSKSQQTDEGHSH